MVSTCKKTQSKRRLLSHLDGFEQDIIIRNTVGDRHENATFNEGTGEQKFTINNPGSNSAANENMVKMTSLGRCVNETIGREMGNIVDNVEDRIQNANDSIVVPMIELSIRSINASFGRDATSVTVYSERREHKRITALFENVSEKNNSLHVFNTNDLTRIDIPGEAS